MSGTGMTGIAISWPGFDDDDDDGDDDDDDDADDDDDDIKMITIDLRRRPLVSM